MNLLNKELHAEMSAISGHLVVNVTLLVVIVQICSHQMRMVGSGQDRELKLDQQLKEILVIGVTLEDTIRHNQTTEKLLKYEIFSDV